MNLRQHKKDKLRENIIKTSVSMFLAQGFEGTTIDDISAKLEISKRTFFRYFPTKEDVVLSFYEKLTEINDGLFKKNLVFDNTIQIIKVIFNNFTINSLKNKKYFISIEKLINDTPSIRARKIDKIFQCTHHIANLIENKFKKNVKNTFKNNLIVHFSMGVFMSAITTWVESNGKNDLIKIMNEGFNLLSTKILGNE